MKINIITLFPELIEPHLDELPFSRAQDSGALEVEVTQLRDFAVDARGSVDDRTYGGGKGMIIRPEPVFEAVESLEKQPSTKVVLLSPRGTKFTQKMAREYSKLDQIILISGRYEGVDARVEENLADEVISIGDYVLSGGELPALVVSEAITRLLPGVLEEEAIDLESFEEGTIEFPQYTRPEDYNGMKVPEVLLSGDHKEIKKWRKSTAQQVRQ